MQESRLSQRPRAEDRIDLEHVDVIEEVQGIDHKVQSGSLSKRDVLEESKIGVQG